jgi:hypothetical protein
LTISGRDEPMDGQPRAGLVSSSKPLPWGRRSLVTKVNKVNKVVSGFGLRRLIRKTGKS